MTPLHTIAQHLKETQDNDKTVVSTKGYSHEHPDHIAQITLTHYPTPINNQKQLEITLHGTILALRFKIDKHKLLMKIDLAHPDSIDQKINEFWQL
jgi:hypothetical protein